MKTRSSSLVIAAMIAAMSIPVLAFGDNGGSAIDASGGVGRLDRLRTETALLQAELKVAQLKAAIAKADSKTPPTSGLQAATTSVQPLPTVVSLYGAGRSMEAVLAYQNGGTISVRVGSALPNGGKVKQVSSDGVVIIQNGIRKTLVFAAAPAVAPGGVTTISPAPIQTFMPPPMIHQ